MYIISPITAHRDRVLAVSGTFPYDTEHLTMYITSPITAHRDRVLAVSGTFPYNTERLKVYITSPITAHRDRGLAVSRTFPYDSEYLKVYVLSCHNLQLLIPSIPITRNMSRLLSHHFRDVTLAIPEITLSRMTLALSAIFAPESCSPSITFY